MLKKIIKYILQKVLGYDNYLFLFSLYAIKYLKYNRNEREFVHFLSMIPDNGAVLDIGANIGIMTVPLAKKSSNGKVFSFEPMPDNIRALRRIVKHYKLDNVTIFETALGDAKGDLKMLLPVVDKLKMQGLSHVLEEENESGNREGEIFFVPVQKLDDMEALQALNSLDVIKIDVENYEYHVLKGAHNLLAKFRPIIFCELWTNEKRELSFQFIKELGYVIKVLDDNKLVEYTNQQTTNFFMLPA